MSKHSGGCHCGAVKYDVTTDLKSVIACNCSICSKRGSLLTFVGEKDFTLISGDKQLKDYRFNTKKIAHTFCDTCGILPFARGTAPDGSKMVAINVRCLDGVDPSKLTITQVNGKDF